MKTLILLLGVYYCVQAGYETAQRWRPDPEVESALVIRCAGVPLNDRDLCEDGLRQEFEIGAIEPSAVVRQHCTRWQGPWASGTSDPGSVPGIEAPALCVERYGGWIRG
jgi:hypothetical protein